MGRQIFRFHIKHQGIYIFYIFSTIFLQFFYNFFTLFLHFFYNFFTLFLQIFYKPETPPPPPRHPHHSGLRGAPPRLTLPQAYRPAPTPTRRPRSKPWLPAGLPNPYVPGHQAWNPHLFPDTCPVSPCRLNPPPHRTNYKMSVGSWQPRLWKASRLEPDARGAVIR